MTSSINNIVHIKDVEVDYDTIKIGPHRFDKAHFIGIGDRITDVYEGVIGLYGFVLEFKTEPKSNKATISDTISFLVVSKSKKQVKIYEELLNIFQKST